MTIILALLAAAIAILALFFGLWAMTRKSDDVSIIDAFWGPGFVLVALAEVAVVGATPAALVLVGCLALWGVRLGFHMNGKHRMRGCEDPRYRAMREVRGTAFVAWSLTHVFLLQAAVLLLVAAPVHVGILGANAAPVWLLVALGVAVFAAGFAIEVIADVRLVRFKRERASPDAVLNTGLWAWSRHPNYFGEAMLQWGFGLLAFAGAGAAPWALIAFVGPAIMTYLLINVSGVAMLEPILRTAKPGYADYVARVPAFWPRPPR